LLEKKLKISNSKLNQSRNPQELETGELKKILNMTMKLIYLRQQRPQERYQLQRQYGTQGLQVDERNDHREIHSVNVVLEYWLISGNEGRK
jgi:hypothetical protein